MVLPELAIYGPAFLPADLMWNDRRVLLRLSSPRRRRECLNIRGQTTRAAQPVPCNDWADRRQRAVHTLRDKFRLFTHHCRHKANNQLGKLIILFETEICNIFAAGSAGLCRHNAGPLQTGTPCHCLSGGFIPRYAKHIRLASAAETCTMPSCAMPKISPMRYALRQPYVMHHHHTAGAAGNEPERTRNA